MYEKHSSHEGIVLPENSLIRYLSSDGTTAGTKNLNGDYSSAPTPFWFSSERPAVIARMIVTIEDATSAPPGEYGALGAPLTNGVEVQIVNPSDTEVLDLLDGVPVKSNGSWAQVCYDARPLTASGSGENYWHVRWSFDKLAGGNGVGIYLPPRYKFRVVLNDDLSGLNEHYFNIEGQYI